jgi:NAD-dependent SIR2 family protein deacetylase
MALNVEPNPAHYALAELARRMPGFLTLTQNVDGLSPRAGHPDASLLLLHGSLFDVKCTNMVCGYKGTNYVDPVSMMLMSQ